MCGIVGVVGTINKPAVDVFKFMLLVDQIRGKHSTGMLLADGKEHVVVKKAVNSTDFLDLGVVTKALDNATDNNAIIGHNRYATIGAVNSTNAHPFTHGALTGVHNGTLRNKWNLKDAKDFTVDSDNLYHSFNVVGVSKTIKDVNGAFALAWHDNKSKTFNLLRNAERPMYYALSKDGKTFFYASERWMILVGAHKAKIELGDVLDLKVGLLLTIDLEGYVKNRDLIGPRMTTKKLELYVAPAHNQNNSGRGGNQNSNWNKSSAARKKVKVVFDTAIKGVNSNVTEFFGETEDGDVVECTSYNTALVPKLETWYEAEVQSTTYRGGVRHLKVFSYSLKLCAKNLAETVVDIHSKKADNDTNDDPDEPLVWFGKTVTRLEFQFLVGNGCSWCNETNVPEDEVIPISGAEFVCSDCYSLPEVNQYVRGGL